MFLSFSLSHFNTKLIQGRKSDGRTKRELKQKMINNRNTEIVGITTLNTVRKTGKQIT